MASFPAVAICTTLTLITSASALSCYSCQFSYNDIYDIDDGWCANETLLLMSPDDVIRPCAPWETYCMTAVTTALNSFLSVSRSCAARCSTLCESDEYGINQVTCPDCCQSDKCNDKFSVDWYMDVMKRQYTSWTKPLPQELAFNRKNNLRFPY